MTKIPWTEKTWNPVVGCTKIASGCKNCYAEKMAARLHYMGNVIYSRTLNDNMKWNSNVICLSRDVLEKPLHWKKPRMIFICSMSDLFHEKVPESFIYKVLMITQQANWHTYQILTKRIERAVEVLDKFYGTSDGVKWPFENVWLGTSVSNQHEADTYISRFRNIKAATTFISFEPALESVNFRFKAFKPDWVIIGCESGPGARLCSLDDIRYVRDQCKDAGVATFIKQIPINGKCNKNSDEWPKEFQIQEYPK